MGPSVTLGRSTRGLHHLVIALGSQAVNRLGDAIWPLDFHRSDGRAWIRSEAKHHPVVVGGEDAGATGNPSHQFAVTQTNRQLGSDRIPVTLFAYKLKSDPATIFPHIVTQEDG